jgi:flagellar biosynthesis component FlhA
MTILKLAVIAGLAVILVVNPGGFVPFSARFILLGALLVGGVLWMSAGDKEAQEAEEAERRRNEEQWEREQRQSEEHHDQDT